MTNIFGKAALALVAVGTVAVLPISSQASAEQRSGEGLVATTATICSSTLTPSGWVDIQWWNSSSCGPTFDPNTKMIQQISTLPVGSTVNACNTTLPPPGWSQISYYFSSACRSSTVSSLNPNTWTLKRVY